MPNALPKRMRQPGRAESTVLAVPDTAVGVRLVCERDNWPTTLPIAINTEVWVSYDNAATWQFLIGFKAPGGNHLFDDGTPITHSSCHRRIRPGTNRKLKVVLDPKFAFQVGADIEFY